MTITATRGSLFPNELYREIARNLHQRWDKHTLLSLALVNQDWRHESQRILFSSLSNDWRIGPNENTTHILFLEAIIAHPARLGPYVYLYGQRDLAADPEGASRDEEEFFREGMQIWNLTSRALPAMINLKHLFMSPAVGSDYMTRKFLRGCQFQLETLMWKCDDDEKNDIIDFLRTQRVLAHLGVGEHPEEEDMSWLPRDICPALISISCNMASIGILQRRNDVVALKANTPNDVEHLQQIRLRFPDVLGRIKYLSVWSYPYSREFMWPTAPNVTLLEIQLWRLHTFAALSAESFPNLRILALPDGDHVLEDRNLLVQVPELTFGHLPKLESVFICPLNINLGMPFGSHLKMSLNRADPVAKVEVSWVWGDCRLGLHWWTVYNMY